MKTYNFAMIYCVSQKLRFWGGGMLSWVIYVIGIICVIAFFPPLLLQILYKLFVSKKLRLINSIKLSKLFFKYDKVGEQTKSNLSFATTISFSSFSKSSLFFAIRYSANALSLCQPCISFLPSCFRLAVKVLKILYVTYNNVHALSKISSAILTTSSLTKVVSYVAVAFFKFSHFSRSCDGVRGKRRIDELKSFTRVCQACSFNLLFVAFVALLLKCFFAATSSARIIVSSFVMGAAFLEEFILFHCSSLIINTLRIINESFKAFWR